MAYDRALTTFSPDGHLFQVEYAIQAVKKGSAVVAAKSSSSIVLYMEEDSVYSSLSESPSLSFVKLKDSNGIENNSSCVGKIAKINESIFCTFSGFSSDANVLIDKLQIRAQSVFLETDCQPPVLEIAKFAASEMQKATQRGGTRPYGVSLIIFGIDRVFSSDDSFHGNASEEVREKGDLKLFEVKPSGVFYEWRAISIGRNQDELFESIEKKFESLKNPSDERSDGNSYHSNSYFMEKEEDVVECLKEIGKEFEEELIRKEINEVQSGNEIESKKNKCDGDNSDNGNERKIEKEKEKRKVFVLRTGKDYLVEL